jgi:hypothetical protein
MGQTTQISAFVSATTRERLDRYVEAHGLKKGAVIEAALVHHLQALEEIPADLVVPARLVLSPQSFAELVDAVLRPKPPTDAMQALFEGKPVDGLDG